MREILFRGKSIDTGEWIYGDLLQYADTVQIWVKTNDGKWNYMVDPETVCQYTGLTDKNGKKIFEGDILSARLDSEYPNDITYVQITWNGFSWCTRESTRDDIMTEWDCNTFEVFGNIYDNPDLIGD